MKGRVVALAALLVGAASIGGCATPPTKTELGRLPAVVTTAEPEWLPFAVRAGVRAPDDPREVRLAELREVPEAGAVSRVAWAADGRSMVIENELGVAVLDLSTGAIVRVSEPGETSRHGVSAGPHGEFVLYASSSDSAGATDGAHIVSVRRDGTDRAVLRAGTHPVVAGDGSSPLDAMFCLSRASANVDVLVMQRMRADGPRLAFDDATILQPFAILADFSVSPDRTRAAWLTGEGVVQVASLGASGDVRAAKGLVDHGVSAPAFHPDGRHVVVATTIDDPEPQLAVVDADSFTGRGALSEPIRERITFAEGGSSAPAFSRDGRRLAFVSKRAASATSSAPAASARLFIARWRERP